MAANTSIEWAANADGTPGATWNPIRAHYFNGRTTKHGFHCVHASEGCRNCYAETLNVAARFPGVGTGLAYTKQNEAKVTVYLDPEHLAIPLRRRKPTTYFLSSMTDVFADFVSDADLDLLFAAMGLCPQHTFIVVTKRSARARKYMTTPDRKRTIAERVMDIANLLARLVGSYKARPTLDHFSACFRPSGPLPNVWFVVSAEDQLTYDQRTRDLMFIDTVVRGVSCEPLLGPIDMCSGRGGTHRHNGPLTGHDHGQGTVAYVGDPRKEHHHHDERCAWGVDWIICGGESGPMARPMHPDWARSLRDQCAAAGVPFFFKQWGEWSPDKFLSNMKAEEEESAEFIRGKTCHEFADDEVWRVGKKAAGRLLDGVEHNARPSLERKPA